jgi:hypothetical protein
MTRESKRLLATLLLVSAFLLGACIKHNDKPSQAQVLHDQITLKYEFKAVIAAAKDLCAQGEGSNPFGYNPLALYKARVKTYNEGQARLKGYGYTGPTEYPEKIPNYDKKGFTDWCEVQRKVTGLSCADDV